MKTFGRTTIYAPYTEKDILSKPEAKQNEIILEILKNSIGIHEQNRTETLYLKDYLRGIQDIYIDKQKHTRPEINNKTVENWAWAIVDFKKCYQLGKPIQYVQINDGGEKEIALLNKYVRFENKKAKDMSLYEDVLTCGRAFMFKGYQKTTEDDQAPFELLVCNAEDTEVIYSSKLGNEQIGAYIQTSMEHIVSTIDTNTGEKINTPQIYHEYTFYLRNRQVVFSDISGELQVVEKSSKPIVMNEHSITEYYTNKYRISLIEIGKDLFNDINYLESLDKDDMESFVNAIMVFTNVEVTENEISQIKQLGAVCINSTENKKASIELLAQRLNATDTQTYYTRLLTSLHQILGVPMATDNGSVTSGDTGKAKLTGQGYTTAGIRAEGDETMFGMCDMEMLRGVIKCCKLSPTSDIKTINVSDIEPKFNRDMSDNLLTKTQALLNLYSADIPRNFANAIVGLFGDANAITTAQERLFGKQVSQLGGGNTDLSINENNEVETQDIADNQANKITEATERDEQGV
jgi:SPP1 family phage portal protein